MKIAACLALPGLFLSAASVMADDPCQAILDQIATLKEQIDNPPKSPPSDFGKPKEPLKPQKGSTNEAFVEHAKKKLAAANMMLAKCETLPVSPAPSVAAFTAQGIGVPDPQVAVGYKYFAAADAGRIGFYDKATHQFAPPFTKTIATESLFMSFFQPLDVATKLPLFMCDPNNPAKTYSDAAKTHVTSNFGCVDATYDARVTRVTRWNGESCHVASRRKPTTPR